MSHIWDACAARATHTVLDGEVLRLVESQEQVATMRIVGDLAEQAMLEDMLERSKPVAPPADTQLHYLLATPFRYPPLMWGSRFGTRTEPSLFYASRNLSTVLAESAYYRFVFWQGMGAAPTRPINTQHTLFAAKIRCARGLKLQATPFDEYADELSHRSDYRASQALGSAMREHGIEAFEYRSARDPAHGLNVALFTATALASPQPVYTQAWLCQTSADKVSYFSAPERNLQEFLLSQFTDANVLPMPSA